MPVVQARGRGSGCGQLRPVRGAGGHGGAGPLPVRTMRRERTHDHLPAVARRADVSRTFLYQNSDAKYMVTTAIIASGDQRRQTRAAIDAQIEAPWHQRALNAEDASRAAYIEIDRSGNASASSSANSAICKLSTPKAPHNASPRRTAR
ncbi:hypothetical protein [Dactylosporangium sp. CA-139066]|uniref:hypothetical protein n=1 Tax=Dactylosporangium sp. CA-139066 TaxID=3239930 RepID=UPI003D8DB12E